MSDRKIYEMVLVIDPAQSEQVEDTLKRYCALIEEHDGAVIRSENWGRKKLAYAIKRNFKGHYIYLNFESTHNLIKTIEQSYLKHNDAILRHWIAKMDQRVEESSPLYVESEDSSEKAVNPAHPEFYTFKNVRLLKDSIMETCRILPRRTTGLNAQQQRALTKSIKIARILSLIPYCDRHRDSI